MANLSLPLSPTNGQQVTHENSVFTFDSTKNVWNRQPLAGRVEQVVPASNTSVSGVTVDGTTLVFSKADGTTSNVALQSIASGAGKVYANESDLPSTGVQPGDHAFVTATGDMYIRSTSQWRKIDAVNLTPSVSMSVTSHSFSSTAETIDVTYTINEPEGTPVTVTVANSGISDATVAHYTGNNTITITAGSSAFSGGTVTLSATDGVNIGNGTVNIDLVLIDWANGTHQSKVAGPNGGNTDQFGHAVAISDNGSTVIAGAPYQDDYKNNSGAAYVYEKGGYTTAIGSASYDNISSGDWSSSVNAFGSNNQDIQNRRSILFNADGTKLYIAAYNSEGSDDLIYQFSLTTPYDITHSNRTYDEKKYSYQSGPSSAGEGNITLTAIRWSDDGLKLFVCGEVYPNDKVFEHNLTVAYDISTASYNGVNFDLTGQEGANRGFGFSQDGTKMFAGGANNGRIYVYNLTTGFDLSTISYSGGSFSFITQTGSSPGGIWFNTAGTMMYVMGYGSKVWSFGLNIPFDITQQIYTHHSFTISSQETQATDFVFNGDLSKFYLIGPSSKRIYQYSTNGASTAWANQQRIDLNVGGSDLGGGNDYTGSSVSITGDGNTVAVGVPNRKHPTYDSPGSVLIFTRSGSTWTQQQEIFASDATNSAYFGCGVSLSSDGTTLAVGAKNVSKVYIYTISGSTWSEQHKLEDGSGGQPNSPGRFGTSVSLTSDGNNLAIGSPGLHYSGNDMGEAYVWIRSGSTWSYQAQIVPSTRSARDGFGHNISISRSDGNTIAVGQIYEYSHFPGYAWIFTRSGTTWTQEAQLRANGIQNGDHFGRNLDLTGDGNHVVIGAPFDNAQGGQNSGRSYIFKRTGTTWAEEKTLEDSDADNGGSFGIACAFTLNGATVVIGNSFYGHSNGLYGPGKFETYISG